jgi:ABC-type uncharacterized transport system substrate-binding protein
VSLRRRLKPIAIGLLLSGVLLFDDACHKADETSEAARRPVKIAVIYIGHHELIDQIIDGFKEQLQRELPQGTFEVFEKHANGDKTQIGSAVAAAVQNGADILVPISTPVTVLALQYANEHRQVCFLGVTDPKGAGVVKSLERPESATGTSDLEPFEEILEFIHEVQPTARVIGFPYSPDEQPAVFSRDQVVKLSRKYGFTVRHRQVASEDDLSIVVRELARQTDCLLTGADNAMFAAAGRVADIAARNHRPYFAGDSTSISAGAVGGYTINYLDVGREGAKLVRQIVIDKKKAGEIPVKLMATGVLELNPRAAALVGIAFSQLILDRAQKKY